VRAAVASPWRDAFTCRSSASWFNTFAGRIIVSARAVTNYRLIARSPKYSEKDDGRECQNCRLPPSPCKVAVSGNHLPSRRKNHGGIELHRLVGARPCGREFVGSERRKQQRCSQTAAEDDANFVVIAPEQKGPNPRADRPTIVALTFKRRRIGQERQRFEATYARSTKRRLRLEQLKASYGLTARPQRARRNLCAAPCPPSF